MASRKAAAPIQQSDIKLTGKSKKDATSLARFVKQEGRAALPFLDDVLAQGSLVMRRAAIEQLGQLDPKAAEKYVRDALKGAGKKTRKASSDRDELVTWLALIGSPSSLRIFLDEGGSLGDLDLEGGPVGTLHELVADEVRDLDADGVRGRLEQINLLEGGTLQAHSFELGDQARTLARALLAHGDEAVRLWGATLLGVAAGAGALDEIRRLGVTPPFALIRKLCERAPLAVQLRELTPFLNTAQGRSDVVSLLPGKLDPAWFPLLDAFLDESDVAARLASSGHPGALSRLRAIADSSTFDRATQRACYALGQAADPLAAPVLLRWLADPVGRQSSPMLLTALGECGRADAIPVIERLSANEPGRATFYGHAIASIRQRGG